MISPRALRRHELPTAPFAVEAYDRASVDRWMRRAADMIEHGYENLTVEDCLRASFPTTRFGGYDREAVRALMDEVRHTLIVTGIAADRDPVDEPGLPDVPPSELSDRELLDVRRLVEAEIARRGHANG